MFEYELENGVTNLNTKYGALAVSSDPSQGYKPIELLVSSIVGCSGGILSKVLEKKRIKVNTIRIKTNVERNEQEANKVTRINLHYIIEGENISKEQIRKSLKVTFKNCAMIQTVKGCISINESFEIINFK
ncbi:OsmC family protein [Bacillus sp. EB600]|uniref:OsmC family protein n=1 Tax=Bacillus sp. EB600 TaxID=2806345 RepID=UPI00210ED14C|nr:OsmC family protein [Bacillus sp. EB600]MCQ6281226.1 OsmC family protein [Bacillus sp. EB600]